MNFDISSLLDNWAYKAGQVQVRRFKGKDGTEKIQLRIDLGLLQMNAAGRPDGKRPLGYESWFEYYKNRLTDHRDKHEVSGKEFELNEHDCSRLQLEAVQYHHRYICLLQLEDYGGVIRDTDRNMDVFDFVERHAASSELSWSLQQFRPQLIMMQTRARAAIALDENDFPVAMTVVRKGLDAMKQFFQDSRHPEVAEQSGEIQFLETWLEELRARKPLSKREQLERALHDAVLKEDYEKAAQVRDALKNLEPPEV